MGSLRSFVLCICTVLLFSCKKNIVTSELVVSPPPYSQMVSYNESQILRVPGNYQDWKVSAAPKLVSVADNGEYEGFVNFSMENTEFWLVKGTAWDNVLTYNQTGSNTFGFNGDFFKLPSGAGVYKVNASTNDFKWSCTKANDWSIYGTAVAGVDEEMVFNPANLSWSITKNMNAGDFVFRANKANDIVFGHNNESATGLLNYNGDKMQLAKSGNYTIVLSLQTAGSYVYSIRRNF